MTHDMKHTFLILSAGLIGILGAAKANAQVVPFVNYDINARSAAMGGAVMGLQADGSTIMFNPAAMALSDRRASVQATAMGIKSDEINFGFSAGGFWKINSRFAVSLYGKGSFDSPNKENSPGDIYLGEYTPKHFMAGAGFAVRIIDGLSVGVNAKAITSSIASDTDIQYNPGLKNAMAFAADVSVMYTVAGVRVAAAATNVGTDISYYEGRSYKLPSAARLGLGYGHTWNRHTLDVSAQGDWLYSNGTYSASAGAEYSFKDMIFARAGYHYAADGQGQVYPGLGSNASFGIGLKFDGVTIDATCLIGNQQAFFLTLGWSL